MSENNENLSKRKNYRTTIPKGKNVKDIFSENKQELKRIHSEFIGLLFIIKQNIKMNKGIYFTKKLKENIVELKKIFIRHNDDYLEIIERLEKMFYDEMNL